MSNWRIIIWNGGLWNAIGGAGDRASGHDVGPCRGGRGHDRGRVCPYRGRVLSPGLCRRASFCL